MMRLQVICHWNMMCRNGLFLLVLLHTHLGGAHCLLIHWTSWPNSSSHLLWAFACRLKDSGSSLSNFHSHKVDTADSVQRLIISGVRGTICNQMPSWKQFSLQSERSSPSDFTSLCLDLVDILALNYEVTQIPCANWISLGFFFTPGGIAFDSAPGNMLIFHCFNPVELEWSV